MKRVSQIIILLLFSSLSVQAGIYRWVDENGAVVYSDRPQQGAEHVKLPDLPTYSTTLPKAAVNSPAPGPVNRGMQEENDKYVEFKILSPANESTVRNNSGKVTVILQLKPKFKAGHKIFVTLDGKRINIPGLRHTFTNIDRGAHGVTAEIVDAKGKRVAEAGKVTFYVQRHSILSPVSKARKR